MEKQILLDDLRGQINENIKLGKSLLKDEYLALILEASEKIVAALLKGKKVMLCGNGGSAADSQHIAAEFVNRFRMERRPLAALALSTDTSVISSIGNDYEFKNIFSKQVAALGQPGDVLIGISTSGNSANVIEAMNTSKKKGIYTIGFTGGSNSQMTRLADLCIRIQTKDTPRIQEGHILIGHLICDVLEKIIFVDEK